LRCAAASFTNKSIIVWTSKTKSLLPSLYKREEFPLFGRRRIGPLARRAKRGQGRFSQQYVFSIMDSFVIFGKAIERYLPP
jgi:hypothetical protein